MWSALQNPAVLVCTIPGCERLEETGPDTYRMTVTAGVASIKGVYQGEVALSEPDAPQRFVLRARGQGAPGTVDATVEVRLSEIEGGTRVDYDAEAVIGGMIGGVGQRMLSSVAKKTASDFFSALESHLVFDAEAVPAVSLRAESVRTEAALTEAAHTEAVPAGRVSAGSVPAGSMSAGSAPAETARVFERPAKQPRPGVPAWSLLAAFGMGAGVALGSAVIGWLLGRTGRRH